VPRLLPFARSTAFTMRSLTSSLSASTNSDDIRMSCERTASRTFDATTTLPPDDAAVFFAVAFFAVRFVAFLAVAFLAVAFFAVAFFAADFFAGAMAPLASHRVPYHPVGGTRAGL
jgi:hypothetical protein